MKGGLCSVTGSLGMREDVARELVMLRLLVTLVLLSPHRLDNNYVLAARSVYTLTDAATSMTAHEGDLEHCGSVY